MCEGDQSLILIHTVIYILVFFSNHNNSMEYCSHIWVSAPNIGGLILLDMVPQCIVNLINPVFSIVCNPFQFYCICLSYDF